MTTVCAPVLVGVLVAAILHNLDLNSSASSAATKTPDLSLPPVKVDRLDIFPYNGNLVTAGKISSAQLRGKPVTEGLESLGAVSGLGVNIQVNAEGNRTGLVRIVGIHVLKTCGPPLRGTFFFNPPQGNLQAVNLGFDLDNSDPRAQEVLTRLNDAGGLRFAADYFLQHEYDLNLGEPLTLVLAAQTYRHECNFRFQLDLIVNGSETTEIIDNHGRPFQVSAEAESRSPKGYIGFPAYRALYVPSDIPNSNASGILTWVAENPRTWRYH